MQTIVRRLITNGFTITPATNGQQLTRRNGDDVCVFEFYGEEWYLQVYDGESRRMYTGNSSNVNDIFLHV